MQIDMLKKVKDNVEKKGHNFKQYKKLKKQQ